MPSSVGQSVALLSGRPMYGERRDDRRALVIAGSEGRIRWHVTLVGTTGVSCGFNAQLFSITGPLTGGNIFLAA